MVATLRLEYTENSDNFDTQPGFIIIITPTTSFLLSKIELMLLKVNAGQDLVLELWSVAEGQPLAKIGDIGTISKANITEENSWLEVNLASTIELTSGTPVCIKCAAQTDDANQTFLAVDEVLGDPNAETKLWTGATFEGEADSNYRLYGEDLPADPTCEEDSAYCFTKETCEAAGWFWYEDACHEFADEQPAQPTQVERDITKTKGTAEIKTSYNYPQKTILNLVPKTSIVRQSSRTGL